MHGRNSAYGSAIRDQLQALGIQEVLTTPASPWQNAYVERLIGPSRRECLDRFPILSPRHLKGILGSYVYYYHRSRTHPTLKKDRPIPCAASDEGNIVSTPI
jgi:transposase InsO family protein